MENGSDPIIRSESGETSGDIAEQYNFTDILESLQCNFLSFSSSLEQIVDDQKPKRDYGSKTKQSESGNR